jgi:hypothetical protein
VTLTLWVEGDPDIMGRGCDPYLFIYLFIYLKIFKHGSLSAEKCTKNKC